MFRFVKRKDPPGGGGDGSAALGPHTKRPKPEEEAFNKYLGVKLPEGWFAVRNSLILNSLPAGKDSKTSRKVAAFDFDGTLALTTFHGTMRLPRDLIHPSIPATFRALHESGYRLVVFTNGATIGMRKNPEAIRNAILQKIDRAKAFCDQVKGVPIRVLVATKFDKYRKQSTADLQKGKGGGLGFWHHYVKYCSTVAPDVKQSFYVGDAAGRRGDHSDADSNFAEGVGLQFYDETQFFSGGLDEFAVSKSTLYCGSEGTALPARLRNGAINWVKKEEEEGEGGDQGPVVVLLMGPPGSGKSTFAERLRRNRKFVRVCQDELGSKDECERVMIQSLNSGMSVVVDRTNMNMPQRETWTGLAAQMKVKTVVAVDLDFYTPRQLLTACFDRRGHGTGVDGSSMSAANIAKIIEKFKLMRQEVRRDVEGIAVVLKCTDRKEAMAVADKLAGDFLPRECDGAAGASDQNARTEGRKRGGGEGDGKTVGGGSDRTSGGEERASEELDKVAQYAKEHNLTAHDLTRMFRETEKEGTS